MQFYVVYQAAVEAMMEPWRVQGRQRRPKYSPCIRLCYMQCWS